jgi:hypothetical protein
MVNDLIRGAHNGPVPAFAAIQEKMQKFNNVVFRVQQWSLGQWTTQEEGMTSSRLMRDDFGDSIIVFDFQHRDTLAETRLYPSERRAYVFRVALPKQHGAFVRRPSDPVSFLAAWYKTKGFSFVCRQRLKGKNVAVYEKYPNVHDRQTNRMTAWVDLETELPIRFEIVSPGQDPNRDGYYGLRLRDFQRDASQIAGWSDVKAGEPRLILDNFKWNTADTSYFSLVPPSGYVVETGQSIIPGAASGYVDSCNTQGRIVLESIVRALSIWCSLSGNVFPNDLSDLTDSTKVKPLLVAGFHRGRSPGEEFRAAHRKAEELLRNAGVISLMPDGITLHYLGKESSFGDSRRIICWFKDKDRPDCPDKRWNGPYFLIYGDLHIATSQTPPKSARQ